MTTSPRPRAWWRLLLSLVLPLLLVAGVGLAVPAHADEVVDGGSKVGDVVDKVGEDEIFTGGDQLPLERDWGQPPSDQLEDKGTDIKESGAVPKTKTTEGEAPSDGGLENVGDAVSDVVDTAGDWLEDKATDLAEGVQDTVEGVVDTVSTVADLLTTSLPEAVEAVMTAVAEWLVTTLGAAAAWLLSALVELAFGLTGADLDAEFVYTWAGRVFAIAIPLTLLLAFWQLASASVRGQPLQGARQAGVGATAATAGTMVAIPILATISSAVDYLCLAMAGDVQDQVNDLASSLADLWSLPTLRAVAAGMNFGIGSGVLMLVFVIFAIVTVIAGIGLIITLVLRDLSLYACTVVLPMAMSGLAARTSRRWPRQVISWLLALIVCKLGVLVVLGLGLTILTARVGDLSTEGMGAVVWLGDLAVGAAMVLLAMFAPWVCFKFFDFVGEESIAWMQGSVHAGVERGGEVVGQTTKTVLALVAAAVGGTAGAGSGAGAGAGAEAGSGAAASSEATSGQAASTTASRRAGVEGATGQTVGQGQVPAQLPGQEAGQLGDQTTAETGRSAPVEVPAGGHSGVWAPEPAQTEAPAGSAGQPVQTPSAADGSGGQTTSTPGGGQPSNADVGSSRPTLSKPRRGLSERVNDLADRARDMPTRRSDGGRRRLPSPVPRPQGGGFGYGALDDDIPGWEVR